MKRSRFETILAFANFQTICSGQNSFRSFWSDFYGQPVWNSPSWVASNHWVWLSTRVMHPYAIVQPVSKTIFSTHQVISNWSNNVEPGNDQPTCVRLANKPETPVLVPICASFGGLSNACTGTHLEVSIMTSPIWRHSITNLILNYFGAFPLPNLPIQKKLPLQKPTRTHVTCGHPFSAFGFHSSSCIGPKRSLK